jgi:hypothetical protein
VVFSFSIGFVVEAVVPLTFTMSVPDYLSSDEVKLEVARMLRISPDIVEFYLDDGTEVFNTEGKIWRNTKPPESPVRVHLNSLVQLTFLRSCFVHNIRSLQIHFQEDFIINSPRFALFQKRQNPSDIKFDYIVLKHGDELQKIIDDEELNSFAIPLLEWSKDLIVLPCESPFQIPVNLIQFQFQTYKFYLDVPADQTVLAVEQEVSEFLRQDFEIDLTKFAVTPGTKLPQSDLPIAIVPLDSHFRRIRVRRSDSTTDEFHQFLEFTTVVELKNALCPAISPKKVRLSLNETPLLDDFQPLSNIVEKDQVFLCEILPDSIAPRSISTHPSPSSGQTFMPNENEMLFHFEGEEDATFHFSATATVGDAQSILSDTRYIFFPPFSLYASGQELLDEKQPLQSISHEITISRSTSPFSKYNVIFPNGEWHTFIREPFADLRREISLTLCEDIDLISRGQLVFDDSDLGDSPLIVCIRQNDTSTSPPASPLTYTFEVQNSGVMTFEPTSPISIVFAQRMFSYLAEPQSITFKFNHEPLDQSQNLPPSPSHIEVIFN